MPAGVCCGGPWNGLDLEAKAQTVIVPIKNGGAVYGPPEAPVKFETGRYVFTPLWVWEES